MTSNIVPFDFNGNEIRTLGTWEAPFFVSMDVCSVLEIANVSDACASLDEDEKLISPITMSGQNRDALCVSESGLYSLVLRSRKPQAKVFKKWITSEVIPAIRKTGQYAIANADPRLVLLEQLTHLTHKQIEMENRQQALEAEQRQIKADQSLLQETVLEHDAEIGRIFEPDGALITLAGFLNLHGKHATAAQLAHVGKTASKAYRSLYGKDPEKLGDARYGLVAAYPKAIAEQALKDRKFID